MDEVAAEQSRQNRTTQRQWQMYAPHRQRIERLIVPDRPGGKLCVLGAGNCNDLDLRWLSDVYAEVHLVDLDADAVKLAVERQGVGGSAKIHLHAPFDLTNIARHVSKWAKTPPFTAEIEQAARDAAAAPVTPWGLCDVVLSPCVLTQTITPSRDALGAQASTQAGRSLRAALRARHLRLFAASLAKGGRGLLIIDLVASEKVPDLARITDEEAAAAMDRFVSAGKNFRGVDPRSLVAVAGSNGLAATITPPWIWHLGLQKSFLVYGLSLRPN